MGLFGDIVGGVLGVFGLGGGGGGLPGIPSSFDIHVKEVSDIAPITINPLTIDHVKDVEVEYVKDVEIDRIQRIAPVATHIKEINNIDPVSVDVFNVTEVRNIEPLRVQEFNITNLPNVNISLRQLPPVEMNIRRLPPVSVGFHQDIHVPSNYVVRMQLLGFEFLRVALDGQSHLLPRERFRREQERTHDRSFPEPAVAGNSAIPSHCVETGVTERRGVCGGGPAGPSGLGVGLNCGAPTRAFSLARKAAPGGSVGNAGPNK